MIADRYITPHADRCFDRQTQIDYWMEITKYYAIKDAATNANEYMDRNVFTRIHNMEAPDAKAVATRETYTGHEVVAFLSLLEEQNPEVKRHLHVGLTSSDLVEFALCKATEAHTRALLNNLEHVTGMLDALPETKRLSRTHGQVGWITDVRAQFAPSQRALVRINSELNRWANARPMKTSGPSGSYPVTDYRSVGVAAVINRTIVPSTQVIHRDHLLAWATLYLRLACTMENIALQVRLGSRSDVGELREGATDERAGSSAMPHKKNPIESEKICGLARVVRGYFLTIAEGVALWEDRDLSNSSAERIAVVGLAGVVEHMALALNRVLDRLQVNDFRIDENIAWHPEWKTHAAQFALQTVYGLGPVEASNFVKQHVAFGLNGRIDVEGSGILLIQPEGEFDPGLYEEFERIYGVALNAHR